MTHPFLLGIFGLGGWEIALIAVVIILIFGVGKLPDLGSGIGKGIRNFKKELRGVNEDSEPEPLDSPKK